MKIYHEGEQRFLDRIAALEEEVALWKYCAEGGHGVTKADGTVVHPGAEIARLTAQRDDLLAALVEVSRERDFVVRCNNYIQDVVTNAIAKARGEVS